MYDAPSAGRWLFLLTVLGAGPARGQQVIPDSEAARHVGDSVVVEARVHDVHLSARHGMTYLNIGGAFPEISFTVHIPDSVAVRFTALESWAGARIRVAGRIWLQDDRWPAITVVDTSQLHRLD